MATSLSALLNIKANVTGEGAVAGLGKAIGGLQGKAAQASGGLKALTSAAGMGGLGGAFSTLAPLLSGAGLIAMGQGADNAADDMNDLAQKTGVSVEVLSKFQQAANAGGSNIEGVGKALIKLNKGLGQLATEGKGPAADGLKALGISATDARGKILSADEIMLRVAEKFRTMPDGAAKTSAAMQLFGKAGADMIPMLNGGRAAIESLTATMTTDFAQGADAANDKMAELQAKLAGVGAKLGEALLPAITTLTGLVVAMVDGFAKLPEPLQQAIGIIGILAIGLAALAPIISAVVSLVGGLAGALGAVVPFFTGLAAVIAGFVTWPVVLVAALVAAGVAIFVFRDQIAAFFSYLGVLLATAAEMTVKAIWDMGEPIRAFWVGLWDAVKRITLPFFAWINDTFGATFSALIDLLYQVFVDPYIKSWEGLQVVGDILIKHLQRTWADFSGWIGGIFDAIGKAWNKLTQLLPNAMKSAADAVRKVWETVANTIKAIVNGAMNAIGNTINAVIKAVNTVITGFNKLPGANIGLLPTVTIPKFAEGGYITAPTIGLVGEAGREYIVPEGKAAAFASNIMAGVRGAAAIPTSSGGRGGSGPASVTVNLRTGPVTQQADGTRTVTLQDAENIARQTANQVLAQLRTPGARMALGIR